MANPNQNPPANQGQGEQKPKPAPFPTVQHATLGAALAAALRQSRYVRKQKVDGVTYPIIGEAEVLKVVRPALVRNGLALIPVGSAIHKAGIERGSNGKDQSVVYVTSRYKLVHLDGTESEILEVSSEGRDHGDKAFAKAHTFGFKQALRQLFMLVTGTDPDTTPSERYSDPPAGQLPPGQGNQGGPSKPSAAQVDAMVNAILTSPTDAEVSRLRTVAAGRAFTKDEQAAVAEAVTRRTLELAPPEAPPEE